MKLTGSRTTDQEPRPNQPGFFFARADLEGLPRGRERAGPRTAGRGV